VSSFMWLGALTGRVYSTAEEMANKKELTLQKESLLLELSFGLVFHN
jgi:hypothetical protein